MPEGRRSSVIISGGSGYQRPTGLLDAISEIQQYYIIEKTGQDIPKEFLTINGVMTFFGVGFKNGFIEGFLLALLLPLAWGVWEDKIPVFGSIGSDEPTKLMIFLFSFGISLTFMVLFGVILAKYYIGNLTRRAIDSLVWGRATSLLIKGSLLFGFVYMLVLFWSEENAWKIATLLFRANPEPAYNKIMEMKTVLWHSSWMQLITSPILSFIPFLCLKAVKFRIEKAIIKEF